MKKYLLLISVLIIASCSVSNRTMGHKVQVSERFITDTIDGVYIPADLDACFKQIDGFWNDSTKTEIKNWSEDELIANTHFGFGMWIRNNWCLWGGSRLSKHFNDLGIFHPDDMSSIILTSYHRYLNGEDIELQHQIDYHKAYWLVMQEPERKTYPKGVYRIKFDTKMLYHLKENNMPGCVHIQSNSRTDNTWIYDYHFGWKKLTEEELDELEDADPDKREEILLKLFNSEDKSNETKTLH